MPAPIRPTCTVSGSATSLTARSVRTGWFIIQRLGRPPRPAPPRVVAVTEEAGGAEEGVAERRRDAARTRAELLAVATAEFADHGFSGARVDEIAARTRTTKRMIYYYFGSKRGLYLAVLEHAYAGIRSLESGLDVDHLDPARAIRSLAELTF